LLHPYSLSSFTDYWQTQ